MQLGEQMKTVRYAVPSRIAINLYDMNGNAGRIDGGMGFSLAYPRLCFTALPADSITVNHNSLVDGELFDRINLVLKELREKYAFGGIVIDIEESIPAHSGFGSKTATILSIGHAYCKIYGQKVDFRDLAVFLRRGGTSGSGINLIDRGGFVLDGGHSTRYKSEFAPSSAIKRIIPAPVLARYDMPNWEVLLAVPETGKVFGQREAEFFRSICPIPEPDIEKLARITLSKMLPAICEADLETFCEGINEIQDCAWKRSEINLYGSIVEDIITCLRDSGALGVGMSSMGPCVYAFGKSMSSLPNELVERTKYSYRLLCLTKPNNNGLTIE